MLHEGNLTMTDQITIQPGIADTAPSTNQQPSHAMSNILAHPGSTWAGATLIVGVLGTTMAATGWPTTASGWMTFALTVFGGIMAGLGK